MSEASAPAAGAAAATDSIVLEEEIDPNYVPTEAEVVEYAKWLGMDLDKDLDLFWVAKEGLMAPLPKNWKPCKTKDTEDIYYFNFASGESTWDHPCDGYYKRLFEEEKKKKETTAKESSDSNRTQAKADVDKLLGNDKKKKKRKGQEVDALPGPGAGSSGKKASKAKASPKPALGPIGGSKPAAAAPLPGISVSASLAPAPASSSLQERAQDAPVTAVAAARRAEPLRASSNTRSDVSLLTLSDSTGASLRPGPSGTHAERKEDSGAGAGAGGDEGSSVSTRRSKMASRLGTLMASSDELQLEATPTKSGEAKASALPLPLPTSSSAEDKPVPAEGGVLAPAKASLSPTKRLLPSQQEAAEGRERERERETHTHVQAEAKASNRERDIAAGGAAKDDDRGAGSSSSSSFSSSSDGGLPSYRGQSSEGPTGTTPAVTSGSGSGSGDNAALEAQVQELQRALKKRELAMEGLRLEQEDAERRVRRACQRQAAAEESEAQLSKQVRLLSLPLSRYLFLS